MGDAPFNEAFQILIVNISEQLPSNIGDHGGLNDWSTEVKDT